MKRLIALFTIVFALLIQTACDKDELPVTESGSSDITNVEGAATASVGQEIELKVTLQGMNGCAVSGTLKENVSGKSRFITGTVNYQGEMCYQALVSVTENYKFKATSKGVYDLRFLKIDSTVISHKITVN